MEVMFDTNVFNHILDGDLPVDRIPPEWKPIATHLRIDEIEKTSNVERLKRLP